MHAKDGRMGGITRSTKQFVTHNPTLCRCVLACGFPRLAVYFCEVLSIRDAFLRWFWSYFQDTFDCMIWHFVCFSFCIDTKITHRMLYLCIFLESVWPFSNNTIVFFSLFPGVIAYSIGIAWAAQDELEYIATDPNKDHSFFVDEFDNLYKFVPKIIQNICQEFNSQPRNWAQLSASELLLGTVGNRDGMLNKHIATSPLPLNVTVGEKMQPSPEHWVTTHTVLVCPQSKRFMGNTFWGWGQI